MVGIYKITSPSGSVYIGQSWDIKRRFTDYCKLYKVKGQRYLYNSFLKYGIENHIFEIVHELPKDVSQYVLDTYEILYISQYRDSVDIMNLREGGMGGKISEETKKLMSKSGKIKVFTEEHKLKISKSKKGQRYSEEMKRKISVLMIGNKRRLNKKHSEETKILLREKNLKYFDYGIAGNAI